MTGERLAPPAEVAICFREAVRGAESLAEALALQAERRGARTWLQPLPALPAPDPGAVAFAERLRAADLLVCVGGDGTVLHASGFAAHSDTPVFGVRMGRLGFLAETTELEAEAGLRLVQDGVARLETRALARVRTSDGGPALDALNDVVIGRASLGRSVSVGVRIDGVMVAEYRGDAVVVSTATGSTGYALSVGGPILPPTSPELVLVPVAPHLTQSNALVLPEDARVRLYVARGESAMMTVDGMHERPVHTGALVEVSKSPLRVRFVRLGGDNQFYANIARRLGWLRPDHVLDDLEVEGAPDGAPAAGAPYADLP